MSFTLCSSGAIIRKAGVNANSDVTQDETPFLDEFSDQAEGRIVAETRRNWLSEHAALPTDLKNMLDDVCSSIAAIKVVNYDMSGYLQREAETILDVNTDIVNKGLAALKDFKTSTLKSTT